MFYKLFSYIFSLSNRFKFINFQKLVNKINDLEKYFINVKDSKLKNNTLKYKFLLKKNNNINKILPKVYANIKEAIRRVFSIRLFDVQLLGAIVLHKGYIAEMKTGEGKTITCTLPAYLNSLLCKGVHIVTVNDYLAKRDYDNNYELFKFLGIKIGLILSDMSLLDKKKSYLCDITYGTNNEYCFDYLKDNMCYDSNDIVQRKELSYAILDEVDSILIDESRTPLIISESKFSNNNIFYKINKFINIFKLKNNNNKFGDFIIDEKYKNIYLTENGISKVEDLIKNNFINSNKFFYNFYNIKIINNIICSLKAHYLFNKNIDYLVKDDNIIIIDEFTGRLVPGKRWSDGLHQAIEAKENVTIKNDNKILASITFQNYFKLYNKLSGMSGTVLSESCEFNTIYNLNTIEIPTNKSIKRKDLSDLIYLNENEKIKAIINDIKYRFNKKQPVLVGTTSIYKSELISKELKKINIKHKVLNAKFHNFEAKIISQAGSLGSVTIATNMAGRGTDIILGGNLSNLLKNKNYSLNKINKIKNKWYLNNKLVIKLGGLHIIGSERNESRRIDDQLKGRCGRQGDPGSTRFYISLDDYLIRIFLSKNIINFIKKININNNKPIKSFLISKSIENAQRRIDYRNLEIRKQLLDYDNIINKHRSIIYKKRNKILFSRSLNIKYKIIIKNLVNKILNKFNVDNFILFYKKIKNIIYLNFNFNVNLYFFNEKNFKKFKKSIIYELISKYKRKINFLGFNLFLNIEKNIMLRTLDYYWIEYLSYINYFKNYVYLRSYAQMDPKQEYKIETLKVFLKMLNSFYFEVTKLIFSLPNNINNLNKFLLDFGINIDF